MPVNSDYKVSVIVPVYNVEQYLSDCLESICRQTLKGIEIIVVNDGSTDNSLSIIKSFQQKYSNIKLINKKNGGLSSARNAGIDMAVGEYLFFVDSDDFIDLDTLEKMYVKAKETHCPLIICGILQYWSDNKKKLYKKCISDKESIYDADLLYKLQLSGRMGCQCCNKLYKREIWISHSLRFREGDYYEDIEMAFKVVQAYQQAYIMNSPYYKYRMRQNSIVVSTNKKIIKDFINNRAFPYDDSGHGTHVSGIIAGDGYASHGRFKGIAPMSQIISVKVLDSNGNGNIENVIKGTKWIINNKDIYNIKIVNISFGTTHNPSNTSELIKNVENMWNEGIIVVAAAGNSGPKSHSITAPGTSRLVITVGSIDDKTFNSGRGPTLDGILKPELVVTGSNITACSNKKNGYSTKSGTSMSAPIVSGAIARVLNNHDYTPDEIRQRLKKCCHKVNLATNQQGWGHLDIIQFIKGP